MIPKPKKALPNRSEPAAELREFLVGVLRRARWEVARTALGQQGQPDLIVRKRLHHHHYLVEIKAASEARGDRLKPLLAQAILEARAAARQVNGAKPLAIVGARHIPERLLQDLKVYAASVAPGIAIGIIDLEGRREFVGPGLELLNARPAQVERHLALPSEKAISNLFSDLNQWMLKVLLAPHVPENLVAAPRGAVKSAAKLAQAAEVSAPSAFRFVRQLKLEGFLDERGESLRLVRVEELIRRWQAASLKPVQQYPMRWLIPGDPERQLWDAVEAYETERPPRRSSGGRSGAAVRRWPRVCLALFAAAEALGYGFVHPAPRHLYLEWLDHDALRRLGLAPAAPGHDVDVFVRQPPARESVFRGAVRRDGVAVADIIQTWLDISEHPARGAEQAKHIRRRALKSLLEEEGR